VEDFEIPYSEFPKSLLKAFREKRVPLAMDRTAMIHKVVDQMFRCCERPFKHQIMRVSERLVQANPESLKVIV
jgi:hypothetical protein